MWLASQYCVHIPDIGLEEICKGKTPGKNDQFKQYGIKIIWDKHEYKVNDLSHQSNEGTGWLTSCSSS